MKTIGLIGGMSWESTHHYYRLLNQKLQAKRGAHHSIEAILYSVDFERIVSLVQKDDWDSITQILIAIAQKIEQAGADFLLLTSNAIHKIFPQIQKAIQIPILHIVDPTAQAIQKQRGAKIALLGTQVTMEEAFYRKRLQDLFGIETLLPAPKERKELHRIIFEELTLGTLRESSRQTLIQLLQDLQQQGAQGAILGCTELSLLIQQKQSPLPLFDTTELHAQAAIDLALEESLP